LRYAFWDGDNWNFQTVEHEVGRKFGSSDTSIVINSDDLPCIAYNEEISNDENLKYAYYDGSTWHKEYVDSNGITGSDCSLALDSFDLPHISYRYGYGYSSKLKYAHFDGQNWNLRVIDTEPETGLDSSIDIDSNDNPHISYHDYEGSYTGYLRYARWIPFIDPNLFSSSSIENEQINAESFSLQSIYPNPVIDIAKMSMYLPEPSNLIIEVFDITGRLVLSEDVYVQSSGEYGMELDVSGVTSGVYTVRATFDNNNSSTEISTKRFIVLK